MERARTGGLAAGALYNPLLLPFVPQVSVSVPFPETIRAEPDFVHDIDCIKYLLEDYRAYGLIYTWRINTPTAD